ncbi:hypothetical protein AA102526_2176 [Asaia lannensis NBRC 102526]|nr:hypothetical protein AA102526_2176 [Asaia lannensis NBRC 102526]
MTFPPSLKLNEKPVVQTLPVRDRARVCLDSALTDPPIASGSRILFFERLAPA